MATAEVQAYTGNGSLGPYPQWWPGGKPWLRGAGAKFPEAGIPYQYI